MAWTILQIYAYMLAIWVRSYKKIWPCKGRMAYFKKNSKMPSMGWSWARSGTMKIFEIKKMTKLFFTLNAFFLTRSLKLQIKGC